MWGCDVGITGEWGLSSAGDNSLMCVVRELSWRREWA